MKIEDNKVVEIHYTLKNASEAVIDSSDGKEPMPYIHGKQNIIPGLETALAGKEVGDKVHAVIPPEEAYGIINDTLVEVVSLAQFPDQSQVQVGAQFQVGGQGGTRIATVTKLEGDNVTVDMNHPLAGETLHFDVEIMSIRDAQPDELEHGHVHGPGGCEH